jgi:3-hydroxypropanoate dehydrogenase
VEKTRAAPVTVIVAQDCEQRPRLWPHGDARSCFAGNPGLITDTAARNSSLQGAYFILAVRALGFDCGPMSGFDPEKVNAEFFPDGKWRANFVCNLGFGDSEKLRPRAPRLAFEEACRVL